MWLLKSRRTPAVGEVWRIEADDCDPWGLRTPVLVTVREVRSGWVRYGYTSGSKDEAMRVSEFTAVYRR